MIKGDLDGSEIPDPGDGLGVVARTGVCGFDAREKSNGTGMAPRVAIRPRIDAHELQFRRLQPCFLHQLAFRRLLDSFTDIDESTRQSQFSLEWRFLPSNHKHTAAGIDNDAVDSKKWRFGRRHGSSTSVQSAALKRATSAALLLYRRRNGLEVLLAHLGGPFWRKKDDGAWTIPKGEIHLGEEPRKAAFREFAEETGYTAGGQALPLGSLRQAGGKWVHAWAVEEDWDPAALVSNTFSLEWPPRSGRTQQFPEIDRAAWFDIPSARSKILKSQSPFLDRLEEILSRGG